MSLFDTLPLTLIGVRWKLLPPGRGGPTEPFGVRLAVRGERGGGWTAEPDGRRQSGRWRGPSRRVPAQTASLKYRDRQKFE